MLLPLRIQNLFGSSFSSIKFFDKGLKFHWLIQARNGLFLFWKTNYLKKSAQTVQLYCQFWGVIISHTIIRFFISYTQQSYLIQYLKVNLHISYNVNSGCHILYKNLKSGSNISYRNRLPWYLQPKPNFT